jgi:hypothetical protein
MADPAPQPDVVMGKLEKEIRRRALDNARRDINTGISAAFARVRLDAGRSMTPPYQVYQAAESALKSAEQSIGDRAVMEFHKKYEQLLEEFPIGD